MNPIISKHLENSSSGHGIKHQRARVVIIGGGFGGISTAKALAKANVDVIIIDKTAQHVFQPLLYQVATATLDANRILTPITRHISRQKNAKFILGTVAAIDKIKQRVILSNGEFLPYNHLVVAPGSVYSYYGAENWKKYAPGLKNIEDAAHIRQKIFSSFDKAKNCQNLSERAKYLRFVVVGGGPTGVELAGSIAEMVKKHFKCSKQAEIFLIQGGKQLLPGYSKKLAQDALRSLETIGVTVLLNSKVTEITDREVHIGNAMTLETDCAIWAGGNEAPSFLKTLGTPLDQYGRVKVKSDLSIPGHSEIFVIGDASVSVDGQGKPLPSVAPVAIQQGRYVASIISKKTPSSKRPAFKYFDKGKLAIIGKFKAVLTAGKIQISGLFAWIIWKIVHLWYLPGIRNKLNVFWKWTTN